MMFSDLMKSIGSFKSGVKVMPKLTIYGILANFRTDKKNNSVNFEPNKNLSSSFVSLIKRSILAKGIRNWVNFVTTYNFVQKSWGLSVVHHT